MRIILVVVGLLCLAVGMVGAINEDRVEVTTRRASDNRARITLLSLRQEKIKALSIMRRKGERQEVYVLPNGRIVEFHFYRTGPWTGPYLEDAVLNYTPIAFIDQTLVGIGYPYYNDVVRSSVRR